MKVMSCKPKQGYEQWRSFAKRIRTQYWVEIRKSTRPDTTVERKSVAGNREGCDAAGPNSQTTPSRTLAGQCITSQDEKKNPRLESASGHANGRNLSSLEEAQTGELGSLEEDIKQLGGLLSIAADQQYQG
eukprot:3276949-Amphidinium_carterae.2